MKIPRKCKLKSLFSDPVTYSEVGKWYKQQLTQNPNVEVLQLLSNLWVDLLTFREINCNHADFTAILLLYVRGRRMCGCTVVSQGDTHNEKEKPLPINSLISSATFCSLS